MIEDYSEGTGTSVIAGTERRASRSLLTLIWPIALVGAVLSLVPLWLGDSRVMMGVAGCLHLLAIHRLGRVDVAVHEPE